MFFSLLRKTFLQLLVIVLFVFVFFAAVYASQGVSYNFQSGSFARVSVLDISSFPSGAEIFIDGISQEEVTPAEILSVPIGRHKITLRKNGFLPWEQVIDFDPEQATQIENAFLFPLNSSQEKIKKYGDTILSQDGRTIVQTNENLKSQFIFERKEDTWLLSQVKELEEINYRANLEIFHQPKNNLKIYQNKLQIREEDQGKLKTKEFSQNIKKATEIFNNYLLVLVGKELLICDQDANHCHLLSNKVHDFFVSENKEVFLADNQEEILVWDFSLYQEKSFWRFF